MSVYKHLSKQRKMKIFKNDEQIEKSDDLLAIGLRILYLFRRQRKRWLWRNANYFSVCVCVCNQCESNQMNVTY